MEGVTIFGIRAILEAIKSGKSIDRVWLLKGAQSKLFEQLLHVLRNNNIAFSFVPRQNRNIVWFRKDSLEGFRISHLN